MPTGPIPPDALIAGTLSPQQLLARPEGGFTAPGAVKIMRTADNLGAMSGSNPFMAGHMTAIPVSAPQAALMPAVFATYGSSNTADDVLHWYELQLKGRGWCSPSSLNTNADLHVYARQQREAFAIIALPVPGLKSGDAQTSSVMSWYTAFADTSTVPAC